ncbi:iron-containing alcohol dehydrogenase family protein [Jeotgalibacillus malaysiensis]|uniref:iron-containing alcohol dehydrogenase family protein n=1 Tax=Jeotgalibacillus malaysiensis TaxID=1508404 RepID=UPI00384E17F8
MNDVIVRGAPAEYVIKPNALTELEVKLSERGINRILLLSGIESWKAANQAFPALEEMNVHHEFYNNECTIEEINRISSLASELNVQAIIGLGGGKVLDITKAAAVAVHVKTVLIPTLASNCAPWTPISVIYKHDGTMTHYNIHPAGIDLLLVDPVILAAAPSPLLRAGIGDTLAKWYEADVQIGRMQNPMPALEIAHFTAKKCADIMFEYGEQALLDAENNVSSEAFIRVTEAIIMLGGMVGGFGDQYGRVAGAHAIHNGLTSAPESHRALHGDKVAYGILVQLLLEEKYNEIDRLLPFYKKIGLPVSLNDLHIPAHRIDEIAKQSTISKETIHVLKNRRITAEETIEAIRRLETEYAL